MFYLEELGKGSIYCRHRDIAFELPLPEICVLVFVFSKVVCRLCSTVFKWGKGTDFAYYGWRHRIQDRRLLTRDRILEDFAKLARQSNVDPPARHKIPIAPTGTGVISP